MHNSPSCISINGLIKSAKRTFHSNALKSALSQLLFISHKKFKTAGKPLKTPNYVTKSCIYTDINIMSDEIFLAT